jgi:superoxide dismutase, Cu-Zn family
VKVAIALAALGAGLALVGSAAGQAPSAARAELVRADGSPAGSVVVLPSRDRIYVSASVSGLPPGWHGFHVHETGSCVAPSFTSAGGHLNPTGAAHPGHAGDMPLLYVGADGSARAASTTERFQVAQLFDADGAAIVVHAAPDNYANIPPNRYDPDPDATTLATGDAGSRIACGVATPYVPPPPPSIPAPRPPDALALPTLASGRAAGRIEIRAEQGRLRVHGSIAGLAPGFHGFHLHAIGSCRRPSFTSAGFHLGTAGPTHPTHAGDLPVIYAQPSGRADLDFVTDRFALRDLSDRNGAALVVHAGSDNFANIPPDRYRPVPDAATLMTGDAGDRVRCGVVRRLARCSVQLRPRYVYARRTTTLRARVTALARPLAGERVRLTGPGVRRSALTGSDGVATLRIRPSRRGWLTAAIRASDTTHGCSSRRAVLAPPRSQPSGGTVVSDPDLGIPRLASPR